MLKNLKVYSSAKMAKKYCVIRVAAFGLAVAGVFTLNSCKSKKASENAETTSASYSISDLGAPLEVPTNLNGSRYGNATGNVDANKVVEGSDGRLYVDSDSASKASEVGQTKIDTKDDTLTVASDGTVQEKTPGYEIKDENGNVIATGEGEIPEGFVPDSNLGPGVNVQEEDANKYVIADADYYDKTTGDLIIAKGDVVSKETLERAKEKLTTIPPTSSIQATDEVTILEETSNTQTQPKEEPDTNHCVPEVIIPINQMGTNDESDHDDKSNNQAQQGESTSITYTFIGNDGTVYNSLEELLASYDDNLLDGEFASDEEINQKTLR